MHENDPTWWMKHAMHYVRALYAGTAKYPNPVMRCKFQLFQDSGVVSALRCFVGATVQLLRGSFAGQSVLTQSCDQTWPNHVGSRLQQTFCKNTPKSKIFLSKWLPCSPKLWEFHRCFTKLWNCRISYNFIKFSPGCQCFIGAGTWQRGSWFLKKRFSPSCKWEIDKRAFCQFSQKHEQFLWNQTLVGFWKNLLQTSNNSTDATPSDRT